MARRTTNIQPIVGTVAPTTVLPFFTGQIYVNTTDDSQYISYGTASGEWNQVDSDPTNDVTTTANLTDDTLIKGNGGGKGVQTTGITIIDTTNNMSGVGTLGCGAITSTGTIIGTSLATDTIESFDFAGVTYTPKIYDSKTSATDLNAAFLHYGNNTTQADQPLLILGRGRGTKASKLTVQDDDFLGELIFVGYQGTDWSVGARIVAQINGAVGDGDMPTSLLLQTATDGTENPTTKIEIDNDGAITFPNNNIKLTQRPDLDYRNISAQGKPTAVFNGSWTGFSLPIYNSDNEELFFTLKTPERWNGTTNPIVKIKCWLTAAETVNDDFKLQLSWSSAGNTGVLSGTPTDVEVETNIVTDRNAQYDLYIVSFEIDATSTSSGDDISGRLRRIAAVGTEIDGAVAVYEWNVEFQRDKLGGKWS